MNDGVNSRSKQPSKEISEVVLLIAEGRRTNISSANGQKAMRL